MASWPGIGAVLRVAVKLDPEEVRLSFDILKKCVYSLEVTKSSSKISVTKYFDILGVHA